MNFKPTKWKAIISILAIIAWYLLFLGFANLLKCSPIPCPETFKAINCENVFVLNILPKFSCEGCVCPKPTSISSIFKEITILLIPGILIYIIWSLYQKK